ncbi:hypothetical protein AB0I34_06945 [Kribbella sp. NPDC050281]|uniref:hypothetical protein n=1 Tax=Kribbella sp. NPDC050281 TaxID=3155515 RepID=UPI0033EFD726
MTPDDSTVPVKTFTMTSKASLDRDNLPAEFTVDFLRHLRPADLVYLERAELSDRQRESFQAGMKDVMAPIRAAMAGAVSPMVTQQFAGIAEAMKPLMSKQFAVFGETARKSWTTSGWRFKFADTLFPQLPKVQFKSPALDMFTTRMDEMPGARLADKTNEVLDAKRERDRMRDQRLADLADDAAQMRQSMTLLAEAMVDQQQYARRREAQLQAAAARQNMVNLWLGSIAVTAMVSALLVVPFGMRWWLVAIAGCMNVLIQYVLLHGLGGTPRDVARRPGQDDESDAASRSEASDPPVRRDTRDDS